MDSITTITILVAEDDADDRLLVKDALNKCRMATNLYFVKDGEDLLDFLHRRGKFKGKKTSPRPSLILLDLNMPKKDGREALKEIKSDPDLKRIPIVAMTTSKAEEDIFTTYELGVNSYITKPVSYDSLVKIMDSITQYWFHTVSLPSREHSAIS